jgi:hypothetical protein
MVQMDWASRVLLGGVVLAGTVGRAPAGRRGVFDASTGRLYGVATYLAGRLTPELRTRVVEDHEAVLTDARRLGA